MLGPGLSLFPAHTGLVTGPGSWSGSPLDTVTDTLPDQASNQAHTGTRREKESRVMPEIRMNAAAVVVAAVTFS